MERSRLFIVVVDERAWNYMPTSKEYKMQCGLAEDPRYGVSPSPTRSYSARVLSLHIK
jgi:hypothetical protein